MSILRKSFYAILASIVILTLVTYLSNSEEKTIAGSTPGLQKATDTPAQLEQLEKKYQATLGVYTIDTQFGETFSHNGNKRFAFASTIKALLGGILLQNLSWDELDKIIMYTEDDLVNYSPITEKHVETGMTLKNIISAAMQYSDNTAANLMFNQLGGPKGFQEQLRHLGDTVTDSSRMETDLNSAIPGDIRDTSTPKAMAETFKPCFLQTPYRQIN